MNRRFLTFVRGLLGLGILLASSAAQTQHGGSRVVAGQPSSGSGKLEPLTPEVATGFITIEATAQRRVTPTGIRMILALTHEAPEAAVCRREITTLVEAVTADLNQLGLPADRIAEDFIAVLPVYDWVFETRDELRLAIERRTGFRMQSNLHLAVKDDAQALAVMDALFARGLTDIIGFDYTAELTGVQHEVRIEAARSARRKAEQLLEALFDEMPPVINVQEQTRVHEPAALYASYESAVATRLTMTGRDEVTRRIDAHRPRHTYYRGWTEPADAKSYELPMKPAITVESTVRLYYRSPGATGPLRPDHDHPLP